MPRSRRRAAVGTALAAPVAVLALLAAQAYAAATAEYLLDTPGDRVEALVGGTGTAGDPVRLVLLGDSTVAGLGAPTLDGSLAVLVAERVAHALRRPVHVTGLGVSGARTGDVLSDQLALVDPSVDAVVIVVGSNDVTHATPPWRFRRQTRDLLQGARRQAHGAVVVLGDIPLFGGATALAEPLRSVVDAYAGVLRERQRQAARQEAAVFVDIAAEASPRFAGVPGAMSGDGFHPAPVGYGFWADALAPAVVRGLGDRATGPRGRP